MADTEEGTGDNVGIGLVEETGDARWPGRSSRSHAGRKVQGSTTLNCTDGTGFEGGSGERDGDSVVVGLNEADGAMLVDLSSHAIAPRAYLSNRNGL